MSAQPPPLCMTAGFCMAQGMGVVKENTILQYRVTDIKKT